MLKVRPDILPKIRCSLCEGYLNVSPVMVKSDKCQICGKCFKILPRHEKIKYVRQVGYETLAEMLLFPCRHNLQGCQFEFPLNEADNHELECPFRFAALSSNGENLEDDDEDSALYRNIGYESDGNISRKQENYDAYTTSASPTTSFTVSDTSECISVQSNYTLKENILTKTPTTLKYITKIYGNETKGVSLHIKNLNKNYVNTAATSDSPVKLSVEGAISLSTFKNVFCKVSVSPMHSQHLQEPIYDIIKDNSSSDYPKCAKCSSAVKSEIYHCGFGHDVCKNCKGNSCALCRSPINSIPLYCCSNFSKGCHVYLLYSEQYLHSKDCEFGEFKCLLEQQCSEVSETLFALKEHLRDKHLTSIILSNLVAKQASNKDDSWIMLAFDSVFKCKRFCYDSEVEFLVEYIGPHKNALNFKYEVHLKYDNQIKLTRSGTCIAWNSSALDQCVIVAKNEMNAVKVNSANFCYTLNLIQMLKE